MSGETVVICSICGQQNSPEMSRCVECWATLAQGVVVDKQDAFELASNRRKILKRRRLMRWVLIAVIVFAIGAWVAYNNFGANQVLPPPRSNITALPSLGNWPMYQRDPGHTGFIGTEGAMPGGELKWRFETDAPIRSSPAVVDGRVYVGTGDHRIVALGAGSGDLIWEHHVRGPVDSSPAVAGGLVFAGLRDGRVVALRGDDGELEWEFKTEGPIYSSPGVHQGELYISSSDGRLYALDAMTGEERWSYLTGRLITSSPAVRHGVVAITSQDRNLYLLDAETGKLRLDYRTTSASGAPAFDGNAVFVADGVGVVRAIDWSARDTRFEKLVLRIKTQLAAWGLMSTVPPQEGYVWSFREPGASFISTPVVAKESVYVASTVGRLFALSKRTGEKQWEFEADRGFMTSPSAVGERVLVGDNGGRVYAIDAIAGEKLWEFKAGGPISSTPVIADGVLYFSSLDGAVYAVE